MMRQMRQNTKWIMVITAAAFVALMVFEWGMDMTGTTAGGGNVGRVGGTNVSVQEYQAVRQNIRTQIQEQRDRAITSAEEREIDDMAWNELVNQILIQKELERRGIRVSDDEIRQAALYSPPEQIQRDPAFQTNGQFDFQRWQEFLASPQVDDRFLFQLEQYYRDVIPRSKLVRQVTSGIYVPDSRLWREWRERNERVDARFLALDPLRTVSDDAVEISDAEVQAYYDDNRDEFAVPARAAVRYVYLDRSPTAADSAVARERVESIREQLAEGADFAELAEQESDDEATRDQGGDLGNFGPGDLTRALDEYVFTAPVGEVSEPIRSPYGYHIVEVLSQDDDDAEARHILVSIQRTDDSEIELLTLADSLESLGETRTLDAVAEEMGLTVERGEISEDLPFLRGVGPAQEAVAWVFEDREPVGSISPVFESRDAFYMVELRDRAEARHLTVDEARASIEERLRERKKLDLAEERARELAAQIRDGASLEEVAEQNGLELRHPEPFTRADFVPGLGRENAAVGKAFGVEPGQVAEPVRTAGNVFIIEVLERVEPDREAWEAQKEIQRIQTIQRIQGERLDQWLSGLRETVAIRDGRAEFFRAAEEAEDTPQIPMAF